MITPAAHGDGYGQRQLGRGGVVVVRKGEPEDPAGCGVYH